MPIIKQNLYIACEDMDFDWSENEAKALDQMWNEGLSISDMAKAYKRDPDEIAILIMDRKRRGFITDRPGGALGRRMPE